MPSKRKRPSPGADDDFSSSLPSHLPTDSINPFSHSPGQLVQFSIAGLSETDHDPALKIPNFPHRGLGQRDGEPRGDEEVVDDEDGDIAENTGAKKRDKAASHREKQILSLIQSIYHFLDRGDIPKAARAYGLVLQLQPHGNFIDVRHYNLWALGAEIIMRDGESQLNGSVDVTSESAPPARWGRAANMKKLKEYFETLIQQYPWDHRRPQNLSAVDFWLAMISCEIYNIHAEHVIRLARIEEDASNLDDDSISLEGDEYDENEEADPQARREARLDDMRDRARKGALEEMSGIASRMDSVIREQPFSKTQAFFRLRATVSMYVADLVVPIVPASPFALQQAQDARQVKLDDAKAHLDKVLELGGQLDRPTMAFLGADDENDGPTVPLYSSLPIRNQ